MCTNCFVPYLFLCCRCPDIKHGCAFVFHSDGCRPELYNGETVTKIVCETIISETDRARVDVHSGRVMAVTD